MWKRNEIIITLGGRGSRRAVFGKSSHFNIPRAARQENATEKGAFSPSQLESMGFSLFYKR